MCKSLEPPLISSYFASRLSKFSPLIFSPVPVSDQFQRNVFLFIKPHGDLGMNHSSITNRLWIFEGWHKTFAHFYMCLSFFFL